MKHIFEFLTSILILGKTTACSQDKSGQEFIKGLTFDENRERFKMIFVENGTFTMDFTDERGADCEDNEKLAYEETLSPFYIGKYEVTQRLCRALMEPYLNQSYNSGCEDCPAEHISWKDAQEFISKLNALSDSIFRLPTEAEWEYTGRDGNRSNGYKYSGSNNIGDVTWYIENYQNSKSGKWSTTHPGGLKKTYELGLYGMSGNVWEWCCDLYTKEFSLNGKRVNLDCPFPSAPLSSRRSLRGGSTKGCRESYFYYNTVNYFDEYWGFRIVLNSDSVQIITKY